MKQAQIRFRTITDQTESMDTIVGKDDEQVIAFEFRNEGDNSRVSLHIDGGGPVLQPGDEKVYAMDGEIFFRTSFVIKFETINGADPVVHKVLLTETYVTKKTGNG